MELKGQKLGMRKFEIAGFEISDVILNLLKLLKGPKKMFNIIGIKESRIQLYWKSNFMWNINCDRWLYYKNQDSEHTIKTPMKDTVQSSSKKYRTFEALTKLWTIFSR